MHGDPLPGGERRVDGGGARLQLLERGRREVGDGQVDRAQPGGREIRVGDRLLLLVDQQPDAAPGERVERRGVPGIP